MRLDGIHHITCITGDAPRNVDFYTRVLGLRLVAKTVNQDDPSVYHLFYASHGLNVIVAGADHDTIHAHFGRGSIDCGAGRDTLFISHRSKRGYKISHCETISFKTIGH